MPSISLTQRVVPGTAGDSWPPGPLRPRLGDGAVHVWRADLTAVSDDLIEHLSRDERARAKRILREHDRRLWAHSRGVLRALLGRYLHKDPRALRFVTGAYGKPALDESAGSPIGPDATKTTQPLRFNLSHSGEIALYAFSKTAEVGVDVEVDRRALDVGAVAARALGPADALRLEALDPATGKREFLRAWVRREAELKCRGTGIGGLAVDRSECKLWTSKLEMGARGRAAVAVERQPGELTCWDWCDVTS